MHPQASNTQTFLPACLLPTACDYNGLDCFDPLVALSESKPGLLYKAIDCISLLKVDGIFFIMIALVVELALPLLCASKTVLIILLYIKSAFRKTPL
jgi:hypothetical protein